MSENQSDRAQRAKNAVIVAVSIEVHCPHCAACFPAPGGSEFCEPAEGREICDGTTKPCPSCDEPVRMHWNQKVQVQL